MHVWHRCAAVAVLVMALICLPHSLFAQSVTGKQRDLADLYRRASIDIDQHIDEAFALWRHFEATYLEDDIPFPLTGRRAYHNEDDIREYLSELLKARGAHVNNATVAGRIENWSDKMARWATLNARLSMRRLWEIKIFDAQHAFGLVARDAKAGLEMAQEEWRSALEGLDDPDKRLAIVRDLKARETERGRVLLTRINIILADLAQWRARLAAKTWRWVHYLENTGPTGAADPFRNTLYEAFGVGLQARHADPLDPLFASALPTQSLLDWLGHLQADPTLLSLELVNDSGKTTRLAPDLTGPFEPVEALNPVRLVGPAAPASGSAAHRAATAISDLVDAIQASQSRERAHMFRMLAALDGQPAPADLVTRTKAHLAEINKVIKIAGEPVEYAAKAAAAAAERDALIEVLEAARTDTPDDRDRIADLEADLVTRQSFVERLGASAERARIAFAENEDLAGPWATHRETNRALRQAWRDLGHARLAGILALWPEDLPTLDSDPAALLLDLEDAATGLSRFLSAAAPALGVTRTDAGPAVDALAREDRHQLQLALDLLSARIKGEQIAANLLRERAPDAAQPEPFLSEGSANAAKQTQAALDRFKALLANTGLSARREEAPSVTLALDPDQIRNLAIRLAALQRQDAPGSRGRARVSVDPNRAPKAWPLMERLAQAHRAGWPVAGAGALFLDDALVRENLDRLETLRRRLRNADGLGSDLSMLIRALSLRPLEADDLYAGL